MAERVEREEEVPERFPAPPPPTAIPEAPKIDVKLPPVAGKQASGAVAPGAYRKVAIASTAASSFIAPILVLGVGGWWLDQRLHTSVGICAFIGTVLGFIVGVLTLMRVIRQLNR